MSCPAAPDNVEVVEVLRRQMRRIDMQMDMHHRFNPNPKLERDREVLEHIRDEYMDRSRS